MAFVRYERIKHPKESDNPFSGFKKVVYYDCTEVDVMLDSLSYEHGYECYQICDSVVGYGNWICVPPDVDHRYVIITEVAINTQCSGHTVRFCKKLSKANERKLNDYFAKEVV